MKKTKQEGFSIFVLIAIVAVLGLGIGTYSVKHKQAAIEKAQVQANIEQNSNFGANTTNDNEVGFDVPVDIKINTNVDVKDGGVLSDGESGVMGTIYLGPSCGVEIEGQPGMCGPKPYAGSLLFTSKSLTSKLSYKVAANSSGFFRVAIPPGTYTVSSLEVGRYPILSTPLEVVVKARSYTNIRVDFESGIR